VNIHIVFFINPNEEYENHALIEMITRSTSNLDIFIYPSTETKTELGSCLSNILDYWFEEEEAIKSSN